MRRGRPGLMGTVARTAVIAGTATAVSGSVRNHQNEKAEQAQQPQEAPAAPAPVAEAPSAIEGDTIAQLKQLAELKDQGILTQEEFDAQKAKLLA
ncbi:MAG: SHOCT domain-containing protein [Actinobacteria bacterium]|nr:SHOCT domain-containing protein [Actinomycetota bacterium]MSY78816.1 SHOCT domain-containing protein [Actinomycetota bacterium]MTA63113.1 SHOCT domain-containing protein [Actinomycetota bacterium]